MRSPIEDVSRTTWHNRPYYKAAYKEDLAKPERQFSPGSHSGRGLGIARRFTGTEFQWAEIPPPIILREQVWRVAGSRGNPDPSNATDVEARNAENPLAEWGRHRDCRTCNYASSTTY